MDAWSHADDAAISSYSISAGSNRVLIVGVGADGSSGAGAVTGVTYGDAAMTEIQEIGASNLTYASLWILFDSGIAGATGTAVTPSFSGSPSGYSVAAGSYSGVDQTAGTPCTSGAVPECSTDTSTDNSDLSMSITEADGNCLVGVASDSIQPNMDWTGLSEEFTQTDHASGEVSIADRISAASGSVAIGVSPVQQRAAGVVAELAQASTGVAIFRRRRE